MVDIKQTISNAFIIGPTLEFSHEELVALADVANGEYSETKPKAGWPVFDFEDEPSVAIEPNSVDKILHCREIAKAIYNQSGRNEDVNYASEWEYFCLVLRTLRCISKCAFIME